MYKMYLWKNKFIMYLLHQNCEIISIVTNSNLPPFSGKSVLMQIRTGCTPFHTVLNGTRKTTWGFVRCFPLAFPSCALCLLQVDSSVFRSDFVLQGQKSTLDLFGASTLQRDCWRKLCRRTFMHWIKKNIKRRIQVK